MPGLDPSFPAAAEDGSSRVRLNVTSNCAFTSIPFGFQHALSLLDPLVRARSRSPIESLV